MQFGATRFSMTALAVALAYSSTVNAQESGEDTPEEIIVTAQQAQEQVVSDANLGVLGAQDALSTPFNVSTYTAQLVLDQQSETIGDVLENDPTVRTTFGSGNQSELFVIRGFALGGEDVAMDGLYGVTPRQLVSPELYEGVQLLSGASAFLFGAAPGGSGIGGGINLIPKRAAKTLVRVTGSYFADSIFGGNIDAGTRFGPDRDFGVRVNGVYRSGDTAIDNEHREVRVVGTSFDFRRGPGRFFLDFGYEDQRAEWSRPSVRLAPNIAVPRAPDANDNYGQPWTFTKLRDFYSLARAELDITDDVMIYAAAGARDGREVGDYSTLTITNATTGRGTGSRLFVPRKDNNESGQAGIRASFNTGPISHQVNAGASVVFTKNRNSFSFGSFPASVAASATTFNTNLYDAPIVPRPKNSTLPATGGSLTNLPRVSTSDLTSIFASDTLGAFDDRVLVTVGARKQELKIDAYNRGTGRRTSRYNENETTPVVGITVKPTDRISVYANRIEGLSQGPTAPINASTVNPGEVFPPFTSTQYEVGAKVAFQGLTGTLALYQTKQPSAFNQPVAGSPNLVRFVVEGEQRNRGIELTLNGEPTDYLRFIGGFTILDAELTKTGNAATQGNKAVGVPDYQVNFGVEVVPPFLSNATMTARVVRTGAQMIDVANTQELDSWTRFDLGIRYVVVADEHPITLRLAAENIDNRNYWYSAFGGYLVQGAPRTVRASATFEF